MRPSWRLCIQRGAICFAVAAVGASPAAALVLGAVAGQSAGNAAANQVAFAVESRQVGTRPLAAKNVTSGVWSPLLTQHAQRTAVKKAAGGRSVAHRRGAAVHDDRGSPRSGSMPQESTRFEETQEESAGRARLHVDLSPDQVRAQRGYLSKLFAPPRQYHFRFLNLFRRARNLWKQTKADEAAGSSAPFGISMDAGIAGEKDGAGAAIADLRHGPSTWMLWLLLGMVVSGLATWFMCDAMGVPLPYEPKLVPPRGRPCWTSVCVVVVFLLSIAVFMMTLTSVMVVNEEVTFQPEEDIWVDESDKPVHVTKHPIREPGKGCFEAGHGVWLSMAAGSLFAFAWRCRGHVQVSAALLAMFAMRGATLALSVALILEIGAEMLLNDSGISETGSILGGVASNLMVGASEEGAKLLMVILGACLYASTLRDAPAENCAGCLGTCWRTLLEAPQAMMVAGLAVGFGFMTTENASYMMAVASTPRMEYRFEDGQEEQDGGQVVAIFTILVRLFLNIHPWWAGLSAGRLASIVFEDGQTNAWPSPLGFMWAIAPSAVLHGAYDLFVGGGVPTIFALLSPLGFWLYARYMFQQEWQKAQREPAVLFAVESDCANVSKAPKKEPAAVATSGPRSSASLRAS